MLSQRLCYQPPLFRTQAAKAALDRQLMELVEAAGERAPAGGGTISRVDLREVAAMQQLAGSQHIRGLAQQ